MTNKEEYLVLQRVSWRKKPRTDWPDRWTAAVHACGGKGVYIPKRNEPFVMAATKDSPVWKALANGAGGFRDAIGVGEPPFAYGSGLGWRKYSEQKKSKNDIVLSNSNRKIRKLRTENQLTKTDEYLITDEIKRTIRKTMPKSQTIVIKL